MHTSCPVVVVVVVVVVIFLLFSAAMSFPASGVESAYRNNLKDVAKMLKTKHEENYMVCLELCACVIKLCMFSSAFL